MVSKNAEERSFDLFISFNENGRGKYFQNCWCLLFVCFINCEVSQPLKIKRHGHDMFVEYCGRGIYE